MIGPLRSFGTDAQFVESWLQFPVFDRVRAAVAAARSMDGCDDAFDASAMITVLQEWVSAHEDFGIWADAIRRFDEQEAPLADCMDRATLDWRQFFEMIKDVTAQGYASAFHLPIPGSMPPPLRGKRGDCCKG